MNALIRMGSLGNVFTIRSSMYSAVRISPFKCGTRQGSDGCAMCDLRMSIPIDVTNEMIRDMLMNSPNEILTPLTYFIKTIISIIMIFSSSCGRVSFNPSKDIPTLTGKVILATGGNSGLGKQSVLELSKHRPAQIWLAARSADKANEAVADVKKEVVDVPIKALQLDLASLTSVRNAAKVFSEESGRLDILLLNAGIMSHPAALTEDGYEIQFGTNHVGHALLTKLLMPVLLRTAQEQPDPDVRVVVLSSAGHAYTPVGGIQFDTLKSKAESMAGLTRYGQSKLANILFAKELARRYLQLTAVSVHPGLVNTNLPNKMNKENFLLGIVAKAVMPIAGSNAKEGARNQLWAATGRGVESGEYYEPVGVAGKGSKYANDHELAKRLWEWTENELKECEL